MKTFKLLFSLLIIAMSLTSCTPQALEEHEIENIKATGDDGGSSNDGSKD